MMGWLNDMRTWAATIAVVTVGSLGAALLPQATASTGTAAGSHAEVVATSQQAAAVAPGSLSSRVRGTFGRAGTVRGTFEPARFFVKRGNTFAYTGAPGTSPLPIHLAYLNGSANAGNPAAYTSTSFTNSAFIGRLSEHNPQILGNNGAAAQLDTTANRSRALTAGFPAGQRGALGGFEDEVADHDVRAALAEALRGRRGDAAGAGEHDDLVLEAFQARAPVQCETSGPRSPVGRKSRAGLPRLTQQCQLAALSAGCRSTASFTMLRASTNTSATSIVRSATETA